MNIFHRRFNQQINKRFIKTSLMATALPVALMTMASSSAMAEVALLEEHKVTSSGLYFWYPDGTKAWYYNPNISPRGDCLTVVNGYIYFGWYKGGMSNRKLMLSRKRIGGGDWVSIEFPHRNSFIANTRMGDSHRTIAVSVSEKDGTIHLLFDHHNDPLNYIASKQNIAFAPDDAFAKLSNYETKRSYFAEGQDVRITYPTLLENDKGETIVHYRKGSAVGGNEMVHAYNGEEWTRAKQVTRGVGPDLPVAERNYAYGNSYFANGEVYYAFSVRWAAKKADGILNEGLYLAKTGPTMTDAWEDPNGVKHPLPIQDYSPFLVDMPETHDGTGSSSGPGIAVTDDGSVQLSYRARTSNTDYHYTYSRKAGETEFFKQTGGAVTGLPHGNKLYRATTSTNGQITISSTVVGSTTSTVEYVHQTPYKLGDAAYRIEDGKLAMVVADRSVETSAQNLLSYVFDLASDEPKPPVVPTPVVKFLKDKVELDYGYKELYLNVGAYSPVPTANIVQVDLFLNGKFVRKEGVALYEWGHGGRTELLGLPIGTHTIKAIATDDKGRKGESTMTVVVKEKVIPKPIVAFPVEKMEVYEGYEELYLDIQASAPQGGAAIANVKLFINDELVRQESVAPYEWGHAKSPNPNETVGLPIGDHTFKAVATDKAGMQSVATMELKVKEIPMPTASFAFDSIIKPVGYDYLSVSVDASNPADDIDIVKVALYVDGQLIREEINAPYDWGHEASPDPLELTGFALGSHTVTAIATDSFNNTVEASFTLEVKPAVVFVDSESNTNPAANMFDGDYTDASSWSAEQNGTKEVVIDLGDSYTISGTKLWTTAGQEVKYQVYVSDFPDSDFVKVGKHQNKHADVQPTIVEFDAQGRYVKLMVIGDWPNINEFEVITE